MARPFRLAYPGAFYHVTSRGNDRQDIFKSQKDGQKFLIYLESAAERYSAVIHAYCLMRNHYHLFLETPQGNLSQIMHHINGAYTTWFNVVRKRSGHLFQGRYKALLVDADAYACELSRYIHLNPVRAGIAKLPGEYPWSSYWHYLPGAATPKWLKTDFILSYFSRQNMEARQRHREFVEQLSAKEYPDSLENIVATTPVESAEFASASSAQHEAAKRSHRDIPALKGLGAKRNLEETVKKAEEIFKDHGNLAKNAAIHLCHRYSGAKLKEIGKHFGIGESAVSQASRRFAAKAEVDEPLRELLREVKSKLSITQ